MSNLRSCAFLGVLVAVLWAAPTAVAMTTDETPSPAVSACAATVDVGALLHAERHAPPLSRCELRPQVETLEEAFPRRTCRCSCGVPCTSSADCGGGFCGPGITCC